MVNRLISEDENGSVYIPNPKRIKEIAAACQKISDALVELNPEIEIKVKPCQLTKSGVFLVAKGISLEIDKISDFISGIKTASSLSIEGKLDGSVKIGVAFYGAYDRIGKIQSNKT